MVMTVSNSCSRCSAFAEYEAEGIMSKETDVKVTGKQIRNRCLELPEHGAEESMHEETDIEANGLIEEGTLRKDSWVIEASVFTEEGSKLSEDSPGHRGAWPHGGGRHGLQGKLGRRGDRSRR